MKKLIYCVVIMFSGLLISCNQHTGKFILINNASSPIANVSVIVCNQSFEFHDVKVGSSVVGTYEVKSDDHFKVDVEFSTGENINAEVGYITNGIDFNHKLIINNSGIDIELIKEF